MIINNLNKKEIIIYYYLNYFNIISPYDNNFEIPKLTRY